MAKRLELLRELVPGAARAAVLVNPAETVNTEITLRDVEAAARGFGLQVQILKADTSDEINAAFEKANPDITLEYEFIPSAGYPQRVQSELLAGNTADVLMTDSAKVQDWGSSGYSGMS